MAAGVNLTIVTVGSMDDAARIGRTLVEERLAACTNIVGPVRSIYRWKDSVEDEQEFVMLIKTRADLYEKVEARVRELHGYEVPEIISIAVDKLYPPYAQWLLESTLEPDNQ